MKKLFEVTVDQVRSHHFCVCAETKEEAMSSIEDRVKSGVAELTVDDIVCTDVNDVWEFKPTEEELKEVEDWASDMVGSMIMDDPEYVYRTATKDSVEYTFGEWVVERMEIPKFADADDIWQKIVRARQDQEDPTPEQFDQICSVQDACEAMLRVMLKDKTDEEIHQISLEMPDIIAEILVRSGLTVHYPTHTEGKGWSDTFPKD